MGRHERRFTVTAPWCQLFSHYNTTQVSAAKRNSTLLIRGRQTPGSRAVEVGSPGGSVLMDRATVCG
jgi:hypothetical protein